jgi:zinc and cadmium transporter
VHLLAAALGLSLLGSCGGLLVASSLVFFPARVRTRLVPWLVSYAVGALLGVALLALLPEALAELAPQAVFGTLLFGILVFIVVMICLAAGVTWVVVRVSPNPNKKRAT